MHKPRQKREILVLGCGAIGLASAMRLQRDGHKVTIWARDLPPATTSNVAAAVWYPYATEPREKVRDWAAMSYRIFRGLAQDADCPVYMVDVTEFLTEPRDRPWWSAPEYEVSHLPRERLPSGFADAIVVPVPMAEMPAYLELLVRRFTGAGGALEQRQVAELAEPLERWDVVVNCTGLGARELTGDEDLHPIRGQVLSVDHREIASAIVDDSDARYPVYILPRKYDVVLGGTAQIGDERLDADEEDTRTILARCRALAPELASADVRAVRVGLRPGRSRVRIEAEETASGKRVVHNYGHGGAGITLSWGCAEEVARLVR